MSMDETIKLVDECFDSLRYDLGGDQSRGMAEIDTQKLRTFILHYMNVANGKYSQQPAPVSATEPDAVRMLREGMRGQHALFNVNQEYVCAVAPLLEYIDALTARLAEAERVTEDAKNLDWLDKQIDGVHVEVHYYGESHGGKRTATVYTWDKEYEAENVRAALTAARGGG